MPISAGILLYRQRGAEIRLLSAHPGGPYFATRDLGAWTIPKGLVADGEQAEDAALREFEEEASWRPVGQLLRLGEVKQRSGKRVVGSRCALAKRKRNCLLVLADEARYGWQHGIARRKNDRRQRELLPRRRRLSVTFRRLR
jgi:ADP-ribose pyrophosphatase YjhB (NUDIX family)